MAMVTMKPKKKGQKKVRFHKGGLHESLDVPMGETIPAAKMQAALSGSKGALAKKQAVMAQGMLAQGRKTAQKRRKRAKKG